MAEVTFVDIDGNPVSLEATDGSLMTAAVQNNVKGIEGDCGGNAACATCHIRVPAEWSDAVGPASDIELAMLEFEPGYTERSRLACQVSVTSALNGLRVEVVKEE